MEIKFETDRIVASNTRARQQPKGLVGLIINNSGGVISTKVGAERFLLGLIGVFVVFTLMIFTLGTSQKVDFEPTIDPTTGELLIGEI